MRLLALVAAAALAAAPAALALPRAGVLVPGRSLAGVRLGETAAQVRTSLGPRYGVCRGCGAATWYFTYRPFSRAGLAVELAHGRVTAVYTLWKPAGWRGPRGLRLGAVEAQVTTLDGPLIPIVCTSYDALTRDSASARTVYYVVDGKLWGFGLLRPHANPCR
jgi:hypothetical protein